MPSAADIAAYCGLGVIQGLLVVLPRPVASARRRSPAWALVLPGALIVGTFGVLVVPHGATGLAVLAAVTTPVLVGVAVMGVVRGRRRIWLAAVPVLAAGALTLASWPSQVATSAFTALACLSVGAGLVRLTPLPWLAAGAAAMCVLDVVLIAAGVGDPAAHLMERALSHSALPEFDRARLGTMNRDYPDLVLAAVLGSALAGHARQLAGGVLVAVLSVTNGVFFLVATTVPATVPVGVAAVVLAVLERRSGRPARDTPRPAGLRWHEVEPAEA